MPPAPAETLEVSALAEALRAPLLRISRRLRQEAQKVGLSAQDALILGYIKKNPGVGVSALADFDQISRPTMSSHVKRLEAAGWLSRTDNAHDGRRSGLPRAWCASALRSANAWPRPSRRYLG
jgi:predicted transcriptional regulator